MGCDEMKKIKNKIILMIVFALLLNISVFADTTIEESIPDIDTDGSQSSVVWFHVFDSLLDDKVTNGVKFFLILTSLRYA